MAKGTVTEQDLAQSLETLGGFGNLGAAPKGRRDSPFGSDYVRKVQPSAPVAPPPQAATAAAPVTLVPAAPVKAVGPVGVPPTVEKAPVLSPPITLSEKVEVLVAKEPAPKPLAAAKTPAKKVPEAPPVQDQPNGEALKSEAFTERITLQMTPEMRDSLGIIARRLQRGRREKGERITPNTLMRVAIQTFIDSLDSKALDGASSEDELLKEVKESLKKRG